MLDLHDNVLAGPTGPEGEWCRRGRSGRVPAFRPDSGYRLPCRAPGSVITPRKRFGTVLTDTRGHVCDRRDYVMDRLLLLRLANARLALQSSGRLRPNDGNLALTQERAGEPNSITTSQDSATICEHRPPSSGRLRKSTTRPRGNAWLRHRGLKSKALYPALRQG
jgi:hypothetical protein